MEPWYNNKELHEMIMGLKEDLTETRRAVKAYNDLRKNIAEMAGRVHLLEKKQQWKNDVTAGIRLWSGWLLAILVFAWAVWGG